MRDKGRGRWAARVLSAFRGSPLASEHACQCYFLICSCARAHLLVLIYSFGHLLILPAFLIYSSPHLLIGSLHLLTRSCLGSRGSDTAGCGSLRQPYESHWCGTLTRRVSARRVSPPPGSSGSGSPFLGCGVTLLNRFLLQGSWVVEYRPQGGGVQGTMHHVGRGMV